MSGGSQERRVPDGDDRAGRRRAAADQEVRATTPMSEFSRPVVIDPWPQGGVAIELQAQAAEREALAERLDLLEVTALGGHGRLDRSDDGREIRFLGRLEAEVVQTCVLSLEPVRSSISEVVERRYWIGPGAPPEQDPDVVDPDEEDIEPLPGRRIDLGEVLAEELALALEPYPRAVGAEPPTSDLGSDISLGGPEKEPSASPFAVLHQIHNNRTA